MSRQVLLPALEAVSVALDAVEAVSAAPDVEAVLMQLVSCSKMSKKGLTSDHCAATHIGGYIRIHCRV